jgi:hypothetical protein
MAIVAVILLPKGSGGPESEPVPETPSSNAAGLSPQGAGRPPLDGGRGSGDSDPRGMHEAAAGAGIPPRLPPGQQAFDLRIVGPDGSPATRALVRVHSDADGRPAFDSTMALVWPTGFSIPVPDRTAWIEVFRATKEGSRESWGRTLHGPVAAGTPSVEVRLSPAKRITGVVLGADREPAAQIEVSASDVRRRAESVSLLAVGVTRTAEDGTFTIDGLGEGPVMLDTWPVGKHSRPPPRIVEAGASDVEIVMGAGTIAAVTVVDPEDRPIPGATVLVHGDVSRIPERTEVQVVARERTDPAGVARVGGLDPAATYGLEILAERPDLARTWIPRWTPKDERVRTNPAVSIRGVVRDDAGKALGDTQVIATRIGKWLREEARSADDGTFEVAHLEPGRYRLEARHGALQGFVTGTAEAAAGATDVAIVLRADPLKDFVARIEDWPAGTTGQAHVASVAEDTKTHTEWIAAVEPDGRVNVPHVRVRDSYSVWVWRPQDGRYVYARGLKIGDAETRLRLQAGRSVRGRVRAPQGAEKLRVTLAGLDFSAGVPVGANGEYEIRGLPDGEVEVTASGELGATALSDSRRVSVGDAADFDLTPK